MRALRAFEPGEVRLVRDAPEPTDSHATKATQDTLVALRAALASKLDVEVARGALRGRPITLGHAFVGAVAAGPDVGKRVVGSIDCVHEPGDLASMGLTKHTRSRTVLGVRGRDGCLADRFALPAGNLVPVPDQLDDDAAVFATPLSVALEAASMVREVRGFTCVLGTGPIGLLCAQALAVRNTSVRVIGRSEQRLAPCAKWGIGHRPRAEITPRADQEAVIEATGHREGLTLAAELCRPRGIVVRLSLGAGLGIHAEAANLIVEKELRVVGARWGSVVEAVGVLARGEVDVLPLIGGRHNLDDAQHAIRTASEPGTMPALVTA